MRWLVDCEPGATAIALPVFIERRKECVDEAIHRPGANESLASGGAIHRSIRHLGQGRFRFRRSVVLVVEPGLYTSLDIVFLN